MAETMKQVREAEAVMSDVASEQLDYWSREGRAARRSMRDGGAPLGAAGASVAAGTALCAGGRPSPGAHSPQAHELAPDTIFVDTLRCTGCWTCALSCMTGNKLKDGAWFVDVRTLGSGEGIDSPAGVWPDLHMSWQPVYRRGCTTCPARVEAGQLPYCVANCPNKALAFGDEVAGKVGAARERGARIYELPSWERSRAHVVYASADRPIL